MVNPDQPVTISLKEYRNLLLSDAELSALECWGVDNWGGHSAAMCNSRTRYKSWVNRFYMINAFDDEVIAYLHEAIEDDDE